LEVIGPKRNLQPKEILRMTRDEFLLELDEILGLPVGTLQGHEKLVDLQVWDSICLINLAVLAETNNNVRLNPDQLLSCFTVDDLLRLAQVEGCPSVPPNSSK